MSTFTEWNGPGPGSNPTKEILALIKAYNEVLSTLNTHINTAASATDSVHDVAAYVTSAIDTLKESLTTTIDDNVDTLQSAIDTVSEALSDYTATLSTDASSELLTFQYAITSSKYVSGILHAHQLIDYTKWASVSGAYLQYTSSSASTVLSASYVLGMLSDDWSDDTENTPSSGYKEKAARAYIKYTNSSPYNAIVDMVATVNTETAALTVHIAKGQNTWSNLAFRLIKSSDASGNTHVYLAVTGTSLTASNVSTAFKICGVNFIPVGSDDYAAPNTNGLLLATAMIGYASSGLVSMSTLRADTITSNTIVDTDGNNLISYNGDESSVIVGNSDNAVTFYTIPVYVGDSVTTPLITKEQLLDNLIPVGAVLRWAGTTAPTGYLSCDGSTFSSTTYPKLYSVLGSTTLPVEDKAIIKAVEYQ